MAIDDNLPAHFASVQERFPKVMEALEELGKAARQQGPLENKTGHLIQLAAAAAIQSEGAVHSHVHRAMTAGATPAEIYHAVLLLVSTIGFPRVAAALSWVDDVLAKQHEADRPRG
ncbi:MAG: carboxymuconolactone decarboxylase family protein [Pirellulales bacterium]|nr:carboxymuconolactone decarboxylase family protein [Pirellulales bacterium]